MIDHELPELKPREPQSAQEKRKHLWELLKVFLFFCIGYSALHKFFVPVALKFTTLSNSPYSKIDYSFVFGLLLGVQIWKHNKLGPLGSLACGGLVAVSVIEIINVATNDYPGWLSFSHLVASIPLSVVCLFMMSFSEHSRRMPYAWLGACVIVAIFLLSFKNFFGVKTQVVTATAPTELAIRTKETEVNAPSCGAQELQITPNTRAHSSDAVLYIRDCGLSPSILSLNTQLPLSLKVVNERSSSVNLHLWKGWNILVPAGKTLSTPPLRSRSPAPFMFYSDSSPSLGISAVLSSPHKKEDREWTLKRSPLTNRECCNEL